MVKAARWGNLEELKRLVQEGQDINQADQNESKPLTAAASNGHTDSVEWLIQHGAKLEARDEEGRQLYIGQHLGDATQQWSCY